MVSGAQPHDSRIVIEQRIDETRREAIGTLIISNLQRSDDGLYACIAKNKVSSIFLMFVLVLVILTHPMTLVLVVNSVLCQNQI